MRVPNRCEASRWRWQSWVPEPEEPAAIAAFLSRPPSSPPTETPVAHRLHEWPPVRQRPGYAQMTNAPTLLSSIHLDSTHYIRSVIAAIILYRREVGGGVGALKEIQKIFSEYCTPRKLGVQCISDMKLEIKKQFYFLNLAVFAS